MGFVPQRFDQAEEERYEEMVKLVIDQSDVILLVLDARMPEITRNKKIEEILQEKDRRFFYVLNKIDLAPKKVVVAARKRLIKIAPTMSVSSTTGQYIDALRRKIFSEFDKMVGCNRKVGLLGYPNVGKSSIINRLAKRKAAKVSVEAGYTKGIHWIRGKNMELVDGPGFIESKDKLNQLKSGLIGAKIPEKLVDPETVAFNIIKDLLRKNPKGIEKMYKIKLTSKDASEVIDQIGKKRGYLKKGGEIEEKKTSIRIIHDWQSGKLKLF